LLLFSPKSFVFPSHIKEIKITMYKSIILPVVLYGCETWCLYVREENGLRVFGNRVWSRIFGRKREEDGSWRKLPNDQIHGFYSSSHIVKVINSNRISWAGHITCIGRGEVYTKF
jgi:hypothetical protein